jgi:hypothetical protein
MAGRVCVAHPQFDTVKVVVYCAATRLAGLVGQTVMYDMVEVTVIIGPGAGTRTAPPDGLPRGGAGAGSEFSPASGLAYTVRRMLGEATARRKKRLESAETVPLVVPLLAGLVLMFARPPQNSSASPGQGRLHWSMSGRAELEASRVSAQ